MLYYVEDSDTRFFRVEAGKMTTRALDAIAETIALNKIDVFITEVCLQRANFPSKTRESYCDISPSPKYLREDNNVIANVKVLSEAGIDANSYLLEKIHKQGRAGWVSIRMNDIHSGEDPDSPLHTEFWRNHPEYHICNTPYENSLDFSHAEVRKYVLDFIGEVIDRYDIDGIVLDWMRFPTYFRHREAWFKRAMLTEIQQRAAEMVRDKARRTGREIELAVRVPLLPDIARGIGLDVAAWAKSKLVDRIFISGFVHAQSYDAPVEEWRKLVNVPITVSLEGWHRPYLSANAIGMEGSSLCGAACAALARGSDGIMIYNMMELNSKVAPNVEKLEKMPETYCDCPAAQRDCLTHLDELSQLVTMPRRYYLAWQDMLFTIAEQDQALRLHGKPAIDLELPLVLGPDTEHKFHFYTGTVNGARIMPEFVFEPQNELQIDVDATNDNVIVKVLNAGSEAVRIESAAILLTPHESMTD